MTLSPPSKLEVGTDEFRRFRAELKRRRQKLVILLDGAPQRNVLAYDLSAGVLTRHRLWQDRVVIIEDEIATEIVSGVIEVSVEDE